eukprot:g38600.t1
MHKVFAVQAASAHIMSYAIFCHWAYLADVASADVAAVDSNTRSHTRLGKNARGQHICSRLEKNLSWMWKDPIFFHVRIGRIMKKVLHSMYEEMFFIHSWDVGVADSLLLDMVIVWHLCGANEELRLKIDELESELQTLRHIREAERYLDAVFQEAVTSRLTNSIGGQGQQGVTA